jgi:hypothetical protein
MNVRRIAAVMIYVPDWKEGLEWHQKAFPQAHRISLPEFDFEFLELNGVQIEVVNADEKVGAGAFGIAVDWEVESFDEAFRHLTESGVPTGWQPRRFYEPVTTRNSFYKRRANSQHDARRRLKSF